MPLRYRYSLFILLWPVASFAVPKTKKLGFNVKRKPNVLFIVADDLQDYVRCVGWPPQARTPNEEPLANFGTAAFDSGFSSDSQCGLVVDQSFGILSANDYRNRREFDGLVHHLRITLLPPKEQVTKPSTN